MEKYGQCLGCAHRSIKKGRASSAQPRVRDNGHVQGWFQIAFSEVGSVRRVCSISYIATMCRQRYRSSEMNEAQSYLKLYWLAISMRYCRQWFFLCLTLPLPFFFPSSGAPKRAPLQRRRKEFFFFWWVWRGGDGRCNVPFDEALRRSNAVQLGSGPEGQGERHS